MGVLREKRRRSQSRYQRPQHSPRRPSTIEKRCEGGIRAMEGRWIDLQKIAYTVKAGKVTRDDGKTFRLSIKRDCIYWGDAGKYYANPDHDLTTEVVWYDCRTERRSKFCWRRFARSRNRS